MVTSLYSEKVLDHFYHPRNVGEIPNPDGEATVGNPVCGDIMKFTLRIAKKGNQEVIEDVKFKTLGCGAAVATSSIATEMIKGKPLNKASQLTNKAVAEALGGLPPVKMHCSVLAEEAVKKAVENYRNKIKRVKVKS